ncbi:DUF6056 family protein [Hymenobacter sp.]|uniref:DUF6056 family protein n=1 Tax=Hymenobacter sp. TaxID=1898978 RepID=UPI00286C928B|nr:DUF6056 family protein [Hymenobacter sp.]
MSRSTGHLLRASQRHQGLLITVALGAVVLPFVGLSFCNHPSLDDFLDAVTVRNLGFWQAQHYFYLTQTGRYTTTVLLALLNPLLYGRLEANWWAVAVGFIFGTLFMLRACLSALPGVSPGAAWRLAGILLALWLAYAPGQAEGLYWFTGAYTYITAAWLLLLWLLAFGYYAAARRLGQDHWAGLAALAGLTVAVAGTPEPVAFPFLLALMAGAGLDWWRGRGRVLLLLAGLAAVGSWASFTAPGNFVRMKHMGASFGLIKTLAYSAGTTGYLLMTWVANPVLLALSALLLPAVHRVAQHRDHSVVLHLGRIPTERLVGGLALLLTAASCPAFYASGTGLPLRARTVLHLLFLLGWFGTLLAWCCRRAYVGRPSAVREELANGRLAPLWVGLLLLFFFADYNVQTRASMLGQGRNNVVRAYQQWLGGEAGRYDAELRARYAALAAKAPVVEVRPLRNRPDLLYSFDIAGLQDLEALRLYATYFGAKQVVTQPTAP